MEFSYRVVFRVKLTRPERTPNGRFWNGFDVHYIAFINGIYCRLDWRKYIYKKYKYLLERWWLKINIILIWSSLFLVGFYFLHSKLTVQSSPKVSLLQCFKSVRTYFTRRSKFYGKRHRRIGYFPVKSTTITKKKRVKGKAYRPNFIHGDDCDSRVRFC